MHAPVQPAVLAALGLARARGGTHDDWVVSGSRIPDAAVREAQLRWYAEHPGVAEAGLDRHAEAAAVLAA